MIIPFKQRNMRRKQAIEDMETAHCILSASLAIESLSKELLLREGAADYEIVLRHMLLSVTNLGIAVEAIASIMAARESPARCRHQNLASRLSTPDLGQ